MFKNWLKVSFYCADNIDSKQFLVKTKDKTTKMSETWKFFNNFFIFFKGRENI